MLLGCKHCRDAKHHLKLTVVAYCSERTCLEDLKMAEQV